jgi:hypothetical protein
MQLARWLLGVLPLGVAALAACGSRTGLFVPAEDSAVVPSSGDDAGTIQMTPPPPPPPICADAGVQVFYVVTTSNSLLEFDPASNTFRMLGTIQCPGVPQGSTPFSMAVDRTGNAYTVFSLGDFYELRPSASGVSCSRVALSLGSTGVSSTFGMGFTADDVGGGESLYIAGSVAPYELARVPIPGFTAQAIGVPTGLAHPELTGNGAGDLYAFSGADCAVSSNCVPDTMTDCVVCNSSSIAQIDKATGKVIGVDALQNFAQGDGWAFGFWGGDFYIFTSPHGSQVSIVTRFDPATQSLQTVNEYPQVIVGAGVSTCAPLEMP